jgi:hypothetical protein
VHGGVDDAVDVGDELVAHGVGEIVGLGQVEAGVGSHVDFGEQFVADPAHPEPIDTDNTWH